MGLLRFVDGRDPDPLALLYAVDALPPATFDLSGTTGWVPTLSLTAYVRAPPAPGPSWCASGRAWSSRARSTNRATCGTAGAGWWPRPPSWRGSARRDRAGAPGCGP